MGQVIFKFTGIILALLLAGLFLSALLLQDTPEVILGVALAFIPAVAGLHYFIWGRSLSAEAKKERILEQVESFEQEMAGLEAQSSAELEPEGAIHARDGIFPAGRSGSAANDGPAPAGNRG